MPLEDADSAINTIQQHCLGSLLVFFKATIYSESGHAVHQNMLCAAFRLFLEDSRVL